ncbi:protein mesh-like [Centruroides sculpturatus]|uniref:protein mesh-like n=1 Tax=Centruroides sculpturatus TaxID=218467 RepID=UPI000C6EE8C3|nr:protein mesh-like [Centruroides sculpturatus]
MASLRFSLILIILYCFLLVECTKRNNIKKKRQISAANKPPVINMFSNYDKEIIPKPQTMDQFRKQLLYPVWESNYVHQITSSRPLQDQSLTFRLPFFGFEFTHIQVHKDGYILFSAGPKEYKIPIDFPMKNIDPKKEVDPSLIAPWFSKQDFPQDIPQSGVYKKIVIIDKEPDNMLRERLILDFREGMIGASDFKPLFVVIITWMNATFSDRDANTALKTNTYQLVLATDELRTYAMFNYDQLDWISYGDPYDGTKRSQSVFVGFNGGNRTRAFHLKPYSQSPRLQLLKERGFGNGLEGRWIFQIDEEVWPGSCIEKELDPNWVDRARLTFFPRWGNMLGGTMVNITGPCFGKVKEEENVRIACKFDIFEVKGVYKDINHATCFQPPVLFHGYVDISVSVNEGPYHFYGKYYIQPPEIAREDIIIYENKDRLYNPTSLTLNWKKEYLTWRDDVKASFHLWGYREISESYPKLTYIDTLAEGAVMVGKERYELDVVQFEQRRNYGNTDIVFGFISMNLTDASSFGRNIKRSPEIWSRPMPLAWYFRPQWEREHKGKWREHFCDKWYDDEENSLTFATSLFRCPCTLKQAEIDRGRFSPDSQCNVIDKKCDTFHREAQHCIQSGRPSVGGSGQLCCYDTYGELLRTADTMYAGRPSRSFKYGKHPYKWRMMLPTLSHWLHDVMPFFFCCKWVKDEDNAESCQKFKFWRTSQDCTSYQPPGVGSVYGDPHFITFDNRNFTFNAKGEFSLVRVRYANRSLDIQGRFEQFQSAMSSPNINGTRLTAIAVKDNTSSTVEFRIRPDASRWRYHLYVIVDKEFVYFWDDTLRIQTFQGVTLYQPAGIWNMSHIVAMFDSGAGIEVMNVDGNLGVHIYLPLIFLNKTRGLLGNWSGDKFDDFAVPGDRPPVIPSNNRDLHERFGNTWRLSPSDSLFYHDVIDFTEYDDNTFKPEYSDEVKVHENFTYKHDVRPTCRDIGSCSYDYIVTGDKKFAESTKLHESRSLFLAKEVREKVIRCPELPKPIHGKKDEIRYHPDSIVTFSCDPGYRLVGHERRICHGTGLWSWGIDPICISDSEYAAQIGGISAGIIIPILLVFCLILGCVVYRRRYTDYHYTGERGMPNRAVVEIKNTANRTSDIEYEKKEKLETET